MIDSETAKNLEIKYSMDISTGCYMYYVKHKGRSIVLMLQVKAVILADR